MGRCVCVRARVISQTFCVLGHCVVTVRSSTGGSDYITIPCRCRDTVASLASLYYDGSIAVCGVSQRRACVSKGVKGSGSFYRALSLRLVAFDTFICGQMTL